MNSFGHVRMYVPKMQQHCFANGICVAQEVGDERRSLSIFSVCAESHVVITTEIAAKVRCAPLYNKQIRGGYSIMTLVHWLTTPQSDFTPRVHIMQRECQVWKEQ